MQASRKEKNGRRNKSRTSSSIMPALIAASGVCGLASLPASALELGDIQINSALGQPLRASIAYALNPTEQIRSYCIYLRSGTPGSDLPALSDASISITGDRINVTGRTAIREPLLSMQVVVDCAYTPHLSREYMLMIDPVAPRVVTPPVIANNRNDELPRQSTPVASQRNQPSSQSQPATTRANNDLSPIPMDSRYRVQRGDSISMIVSRIENRTLGLWATVDIVFSANKKAFVDGDVNRLLAGYELVIPNLAESADATAPAPAPTVSSTSNLDSLSPAIELAEEPTPTATESPADAITNAVPVVDNQEAPVETNVPDLNTFVPVTDQSVDLQPGDVIVAPVESIDIYTVTTEAGTDNSATSAPVVISIADETGINSGWNWLFWLGGAGIALILGLLMFGRSLKGRFGSLGGGTAIPGRRQGDDPTIRTQAPTVVDIEFEDTINAETISLDADLGAGTGLNPVGQIIVSEEFDFSDIDQQDDKLDFEMTEAAARETDTATTDIIPPSHSEEMNSILVKEEVPVDDDEEYDMSMIVDATRQTLDEFDATAKDLQAVPISGVKAVDDDSDYTINSAVDIQSLEQDYEDEFTATQAANAEIQRIAIELASRMDAAEDAETTNEMPFVSNSTTEELSGADMTAEMPGPDVTREMQKLDLPEVSDTDITAELTANLPTSIEAENDSNIDGAGSELAVEMSAGSDITVEMTVQSGKVDTKKK